MNAIQLMEMASKGIKELKQLFLYDKIYCLGIYEDSVHHKVSYALLEGAKANGESDREVVSSGISEDVDGALCELLKDNIRNIVVVLARPTNEIFYYVRSFPVMAEEDIGGAVHWELEVNGPKLDKADGSEYVYGYAYAAEEKGFRVRIGAAERSSYEKVSKLVINAGHSFAGIAVIEDIATGIGRAVAAANSCMDVMLHSDGYRDRLILGRRFVLSPMINWGKVGMTITASVLCVLMLGAGTCLALHKKYVEEASSYQHRLALLQDVEDSFIRSGQLEREIQAINEQLAAHNRDGIPAEALMVHLGSIITKGIVLTEVRADENSVGIKGYAASYSALTRFYKVLEKDKEFFAHGAKLEKSEAERNGQAVAFSIKGRL